VDAITQLPQVDGAVVYLAKTADKPHTYTYDPPDGVPKSNIVTEQHVVPIFDMRPLADGLSLSRLRELDQRIGVRFAVVFDS